MTGAAHTADRTPAHSTRGANPARLPGRAPAAHHQEHAIAVTTNLTPPDARRGDWEIRCTSCGLVAIHPDRIAAETLASQHAAGHIDAARIRTRVRVR